MTFQKTRHSKKQLCFPEYVGSLRFFKLLIFITYSLRPNTHAPFLVEAGIKFDLERIRSGDFSDIARICEDKVFSKGIMLVLKKLSDLPIQLLLDLVKYIVPLPLHEVVETMTVNAFKSKIQVLQKNNKKEKKTKKIYDDFLQQEFIFTPETRRVSPRKRKLNEESLQSKKSAAHAEEQLKLLREERVSEFEELEKLEAENTVVKEKLDYLESEKLRLSQKIKGIRSGISRKRSSSAGSSHENDEGRIAPRDRSTKATSTLIDGIFNNDLIVVEDKAADKIFPGKKYFGCSSKHKKSSGGWMHVYAELSDDVNPCSKVTKKEVQKRAKFIDDVALKISCSSSKNNNDEEKRVLYTELVQQHRYLLRDVLENAGLNIYETLTSEQTLDMQTLLRMPTNNLRNLRTGLNNFSIDILPSERKMRMIKAPKTSHVSEDKIESGFIGLRKTRNDEDVTPCSYIRVNNLKNYIEEIIDRDTAGFLDDEKFDNKWWLLFAGDKGGNHMKFHVEVINSKKAGSVDNVHIYCMFEAQDSVENMHKVWLLRRNQSYAS